MNNNWFEEILLPGALTRCDDKWINPDTISTIDNWSFNQEWKQHLYTLQQKTWDLTAKERLQHFYLETRTSPVIMAGKLILDAGCGNGQLTRALSETGALVVGIDRQPYLPAGNEHLEFVQSDFDKAPFKAASFDIIIANGSIHHTPDTRNSFKSLASLVKPAGCFYVWVYKKQKGGKRMLTWLLDDMRFIISRFPLGLQAGCVKLLTTFFYKLSRIRKGENSKRTKDEIRINVYDAFTPRYRSYHTIEEVTQWFFAAGFSSIEATHTNNQYGFGIVGIKQVQ